MDKVLKGAMFAAGFIGVLYLFVSASPTILNKARVVLGQQPNTYHLFTIR